MRRYKQNAEDYLLLRKIVEKVTIEQIITHLKTNNHHE